MKERRSRRRRRTTKCQVRRDDEVHRKQEGTDNEGENNVCVCVCVWGGFQIDVPFHVILTPPLCDAAALRAAFADSPLTHHTSRSETHADPPPMPTWNVGTTHPGESKILLIGIKGTPLRQGRRCRSRTVGRVASMWPLKETATQQ